MIETFKLIKAITRLIAAIFIFLALYERYKAIKNNDFISEVRYTLVVILITIALII